MSTQPETNSTPGASKDFQSRIETMVREQLASGNLTLGEALGALSFTLISIAARAGVPEEALKNRLLGDVEMVYKTEKLLTMMNQIAAETEAKQ